MSNSSLPLNNLSETQRKAFNTHLNDLWDEYQDQLADLIIEARTLVPNAAYDEGDPLASARSLLADYTRQANILANDYYRNVRNAWAEASGTALPGYADAQVSSDRAFWQVVGGYNDTMFVGLKYTDVINGRSHAGLTIDDLWASKTKDYTDADWAALAKDIINATTRLTTMFDVQADPTGPRYARVPQGKTCAFCSMLASRGFVYASEDTAGKWHQYHHDCDCKIVPSWGETRIDGYDPAKLKTMYEQAKTAAKHAGQPTSVKNVLSWMRANFPDLLKDGSSFEPDMRIPKGSEIERQLGALNTLRINQMLKKTPHKDTAKLWAKHAADYRIKQTSHKGTAYFSNVDAGMFVNVKELGLGDDIHRPYGVWFHESGHMLDWLLNDKQDTYYSETPHNGKFLADRLNTDAASLYMATTQRLKAAGKPTTRADVLDAIADEIQTSTALTDRNIEDMLQAALGDDYPRSVGHPDGYYPKYSYHRQAAEAFAEMIDAQLSNPQAWNLTEKYFPESVKLYESMIKEATA